MAAHSHGRGHASWRLLLQIAARAGPDDALEMPRQMALIGETEVGRRGGNPCPLAQPPARLEYAQLDLIGSGRDPDLVAEAAQKMIWTEPDVRGKFAQTHRLGEPRVQICPGQRDLGLLGRPRDWFQAARQLQDLAQQREELALELEILQLARSEEHTSELQSLR